MISNADVFSVVIVDLATIINTFFSTNFLIFMLLFPLPTVLLTVFSLKDNITYVLSYCFLSVLIAIVLSLVLFNISFLFVVFLALYLITNAILVVLAKQKFNVVKKPFTVINYVGAKATMFFCIVLFIILFLAIAPAQQQNAINFQAGMVNLFVGDDLSSWLGTSYNLSYVCTKQNFEQLIRSPQFKNLKQNNDSTSVAFVQFVEGYSEDLLDGRMSRSQALLPDLTAIELKEDVLNTLREIPLMNFIEKYFGIIFAILIVSIVYVYFVFAFSIFSLFLFFLFLKIIYKKDDFKKSPKNKLSTNKTQENKNLEEKPSNKNIPEDKEDVSKEAFEEYFSQKDGPRKEIK